MTPNYPTSLDNGTSMPNPTSTSTRNNPSLADGQTTQNEAIIALETKVGIGSATPSLNTVLRGTGSGTTAFEQVVLTTDVSGILPVANGGTGSSTQTFVDLAGDLGNTVTSPEVVSTHLTAPLPIAQGGTGSTTQNFVDLTTAQTIAGLKTFSNQITGNDGGIINVSGSSANNGLTITMNSSAASNPALYVSDDTNYAQSGNLIEAKLLNTSDTADLVNLSNVGTGLSIASSNGTSNTFTVDKSGNTVASGTLDVTGHVTLEGVTSTGATGTGELVFNTSPTITTPTISSIVNTGTLTLPTSTDTLVGRATTDTITNKDLTSTTNTFAIPSSGANFSKTGPDTNGWYKKDYGNWQEYYQQVTVTSVAVAANSYTQISTIGVPVGITNTSSLYFTVGVLGGYGGRIYATLDNGNVTSGVTTFILTLGNSTTSSITFSGFVGITAHTL